MRGPVHFSDRSELEVTTLGGGSWVLMDGDPEVDINTDPDPKAHNGCGAVGGRKTIVLRTHDVVMRSVRALARNAQSGNPFWPSLTYIKAHGHLLCADWRWR